MIRKFYFTLITIISISSFSFAQDSYSPTKTEKAAFYDKSPRLDEMPAIPLSKADNGWKEGVVENETAGMEFENADNFETDPATIQSDYGTKASKGPLLNIDGIGNINGVVPPDTEGDVGPDHYIQMINLSFAVYDKDGTKLYGPVANSTLWTGFPGPWSGTNDGDPVVLYDEMADRWVGSQFAVSTSNNKYYELIAVSETGDPLGSWYRYAFEFDKFPDYPKLSVWLDGYYATFHMFQGNFKGMAAVVFERDKMLTGDPSAQMVYFGEYSTRFGYLPSDIDGTPPPAGTPCYFAGINFNGNHSMEIWEMVPDWTNTANSTFTLAKILNPASFNSNVPGIPQPGTGQTLDDFSNVLMYRLPFRTFGSYNVLMANHTVRVGNTSGIRWYELRDDGTGWAIYQQGTYSPDNDNRWLGSIAMAANGNIALGFSVSSSSVYPSIRYTGRSPDAPAGEMNFAEVEVQAGVSSQNGINRWGDYACMSVDPVTDTIFWFTTEYMKSGGWGTHITSFDFGALQQPSAYAGEDVTLCDDELFEATGATATAQTSVLWETSGDGIFQNPNIINTKYLRGNGDLENGFVTLTFTAYGFKPGWEDSDYVELTFVLSPEADAGPDMQIQPGETAQLDGGAVNYATITWTTTGDGSFNDTTLLNAVYTPGTEDIANGSAQLTLHAYPNNPCQSVDDDALTLTINNMTGTDRILTSEPRISVVPNPSSGIFNITFDGFNTQEVTLIITDLKGKIVLNRSLKIPTESSTSVDLSALPQGVYIAKITGSQAALVEKIVRN